MSKHISDHILADFAFDPSIPLANLADAKARVKNKYAITQPQLEELVLGFEKMARAYKNIIFQEMEAAANERKSKLITRKSRPNGNSVSSSKLLTRKKKTDKR